jgi:hypothetical protein
MIISYLNIGLGFILTLIGIVAYFIIMAFYSLKNN